jgi:hypothetical protein
MCLRLKTKVLCAHSRVCVRTCMCFHACCMCALVRLSARARPDVRAFVALSKKFSPRIALQRLGLKSVNECGVSHLYLRDGQDARVRVHARAAVQLRRLWLFGSPGICRGQRVERRGGSRAAVAVNAEDAALKIRVRKVLRLEDNNGFHRVY